MSAKIIIFAYLISVFGSAAATASTVVNPDINNARARLADTCVILVRSMRSACEPPRMRSLKTEKTLSSAQNPILRAKMVT